MHPRCSPQHFTEGSGKQGKINKLVAGPNGPTWTRSLANKFGSLCTGIRKTRPKADRIEGTGTMFFTTKYRIPKGRKITYAKFICNIRPQKSETHRIRLTAGGDKLDYPGDPSSPAVSLLNLKIQNNSTISRAKNNARYMCIDIKNFYLGTPMKYFQYMRIQKKVHPPRSTRRVRHHLRRPRFHLRGNTQRHVRPKRSRRHCV